MRSYVVLKSGAGLLPMVLALGLMEGCDGDKKDKRKGGGQVVTPVQPQAPVNCADGLNDGQSQELTLYRKEFASYGQACKDLAFEGTVSCKQGQKLFQDNGSPSCQETELTGLAIVSELTTIEIDQDLALKLEGVDQRGGKHIIDPNLAQWSSSNELLTVSASGVVSAKQTLEDVLVTAKIGELKAEYRVSVTGRSCADLRDGESRNFDTRFRSARVAFNATCERITVKGVCTNGTVTFEPGSAETCVVAELTQLTAEPATLFLKKDESDNVKLFLIDEIGTKVALAPGDATWELPAGGLLKLENGRITALSTPTRTVKIKVSAHGLETNVSVSRSMPDQVKFKRDEWLVKAGDELALEIEASEPLDLDQLNWESSDPTAVSVEVGKIKALKPGSVATITAKLGGKQITTQVKVEATLEVDVKPVIYPGIQSGQVHPLTDEKLVLNPAYTLTLKGPAQEQNIELTSVTEGCKFSSVYSPSSLKWEIRAELDEMRETIPNRCEAEMALSTVAGQKLTHKFSIPVDYFKGTMVESLPKVTDEGLEVARITLKTSSSYSFTSATVTALKNDIWSACEWNIVQEGQVYRVLAKGDADKTCLGQVVIKMHDSNDNLSNTYSDLVLVSSALPIKDVCVNAAASSPNDPSRVTFDTIRKAARLLSVECQEVSEDLRYRNLVSLLAKDDEADKHFGLPLTGRKREKGLTDLSPLARLVGLKALQLSVNENLENISPLKDLKALVKLNLKETKVSDFSPIYGHKLMQILNWPNQAPRIASCPADVTNMKIKEVCIQ